MPDTKLVGIYSVCRVSTECKMLSGSEILTLYKAGHKHTQPYMPSRWKRFFLCTLAVIQSDFQPPSSAQNRSSIYFQLHAALKFITQPTAAAHLCSLSASQLCSKSVSVNFSAWLTERSRAWQARVSVSVAKYSISIAWAIRLDHGFLSPFRLKNETYWKAELLTERATNWLYWLISWLA